METSLYRLFSPDGELLYVGISLTPVNRLGSHRSRSFWPSVGRIEVEQFDTRPEAAQAEAQAIQDENPTFNLARPRGPSESEPDLTDASTEGQLRLAAVQTHRWTERRNALVCALVNRGDSLRVIGELAGLSHTAVKNIHLRS